MFGVVGWVFVGACAFDKHTSRSSPGQGWQRPPALKHSGTKLCLRTTPVNNIQKCFANALETLEQITPPMLKKVHRQANTENLKQFISQHWRCGDRQEPYTHKTISEYFWRGLAATSCAFVWFRFSLSLSLSFPFLLRQLLLMRVSMAVAVDACFHVVVNQTLIRNLENSNKHPNEHPTHKRTFIM